MTHTMTAAAINILITSFIIGYGEGWRAVPANQAQYALRSADVGEIALDYLLPRTFINSVHKFGECEAWATRPQFLRTTVNVSLDTYDDSQGAYLYVLADMVTERFHKQCIVMKTYVPRKYLFYKSRLPLYYCQGQMYIVMLDTIHRLAIHEFYAQKRIDLPVTIYFEFYSPNLSDFVREF